VPKTKQTPNPHHRIHYGSTSPRRPCQAPPCAARSVAPRLGPPHTTLLHHSPQPQDYDP
jgi:hypothetical protein